MSSATLLLIFAAACSSLLLVSSRKMDTNREALIQSAIAEVKHEFSTMKKPMLSKTQAKLHAFKKASPQSMAQGLASLKFERMVKVAEKKILRNQRLASAQTTSSMAEALATELLHKPGSILSAQEIARIYQVSDCANTLPTPTNCNTPAAKFHRTPDGSCNNIANPTLGAAGTPLSRLISARYDDGISRPRGYLQSQGSPLFNGVFSAPTPSARVASIAIIQDREDNDTMYTHMLMQWGQFMDHDLNAIPEHQEDCSCEVPESQEGSCYPFRIPEDDTAVLVTRTASGNVGCFRFRRSLGVCPDDAVPITELPPREQLNGITHFVDGSNVYGHTVDILNNELRDQTSNAGLLKTGPPATEGGSRPLLPDAAEGSFVLCPQSTQPCFVAGDFRVNEQSALTVMHTVWVREHNRIAQFIRDNNPSFTSSKVFLTTREIVTSEIQKITYQDFLPILLGDSFPTLVPLYVGYDPNIDPSIPNAFAAAAYRYGHSQIQPFFERLDEDLQSIPAGPLALVDAFFDTSHVRQFGTDAIVRGLVAKPARAVDEFLNSILTNRLFADNADTPGLDLASLNIQRGRDHGLPTYLTWKQWAEERCGVESDFRHELTEIHLLQTYGSLDSVDLFVGGLAEKPLPGGLVGAVFGCIIAQTFKALRDGDRFYYENSNPDTGLFTPAQIEQLNLATLSHVLCDNTDITQIQPNAFLADQPRVACSDFPSVNLTLWNQVTLPDLCYIKVASAEAGSYFSVSRRTTASRFHFHHQLIRAGSEVCYPVLCPKEDGATILAVVARQNAHCAPERNQNIPEPLQSPRNAFVGILDVDAFTQRGNGIYTDLESCEAASAPDALTYNCYKLRATQQQDTDIDIDTDSEDKIRDLVDNDEILNEIIGGTVSASSNEDKLVSLMEEMIKELKLAKASSHKKQKVEQLKKEMKTSDVASDSSLVSELEKVLRELE